MATERPTQSRTHVIAAEQAKRAVQSRCAPLPPPKPASIPGAPQMAPDLQLHPAFNELEAATRVPDGEIAHPAPQDRIDEGHHRLHGLRSISPKDLAPDEIDPPALLLVDLDLELGEFLPQPYV